MDEFSLSMVWNCDKYSDGQDIVAEILALGFKSIEVNFKLSAEKLRDVEYCVDEGLVAVSSVHNYAPYPDLDDNYVSQVNPDSPSISAVAEAERSLAVSYTKQSIMTAKKLNARFLVLHCGYVDIAKRTRELCRIANLHGKASRKFKSLFMEAVDERASKRAQYFDSLCTSIDELVLFAKKHGVVLGIENRFHYCELPAPDEFSKLFHYFGSDCLGYWHDIGHAFVLEKLGFYPGGKFLGEFNKRMIGVHLHDVLAYHDHCVPFLGEFDWNFLKRFDFDNIIKVIEVEPSNHAKDIVECLQKFKKYNIFKQIF